jgi:hypothetical protein
MLAMFVPTGVASAQPIGAPLIEYTRFPGGNWGSFDVSDSFGLPAALINAVPWVDPVTGYQNEYAVATNNHLIEYTRLPTGQWVAADLTALANGPLVTNTPAPFDDSPTVVFSTGTIQAVAVTTTSGHLAVYTRQPMGGWSSVDLTASFNGPGITADPAPFIDPLTGFLNVYVTSANDHLVEYTRMQTRWITVDITAAYGGPRIIDHPAPFVDPVTGLQNVYTTTVNSHLAEYTRNPNGSWISVDLTGVYAGSPVPSSPAPFDEPHFINDPNAGAQIAFATTTASHLVEYIRQPKGNWQIVDLTASYSGALVPGDPLPFVDPLTGFLNVYVTGIG